MKKSTLVLLSAFCCAGVSAQYSTGVVALNSSSGTPLGMSAKIDVSASLVTLTLTGASTDWMGIGFGSTNMLAGGDCVIFDGTSLTDRTFGGVGVVPALDAGQDWTVTSNTITGGTRTVVGTRALNTGDANDYVFSAAASPLTLVFARKSGSLAIGYHGGDSCGSTVANIVLSTGNFSAESVKMFPNPAKGLVNFEFPSSVTSGEIKFYDAQGRMVRRQEIGAMQASVALSGMQSGTYMTVVRTEYGTVTKTLIVD